MSKKERKTMTKQKHVKSEGNERRKGMKARWRQRGGVGGGKRK